MEKTIIWPCAFKLTGDDELILLRSESDLLNECEHLIWSDEDVLIDAAGNGYTLFMSSSGELTCSALERHYSLKEVTRLIQAHEFSKAEMCLTKIHFLTIDSAIKSLFI